MSTVNKRETPKQPERPNIMNDHIIRLEVATETMMSYVGHLNTAIMQEEEQAKPNLAKIQALQDEMDKVSKEHREIMPDDEKLIAKGIYVYGRIMKAFYDQA